MSTKTIDPDKFYVPKEIARNGWITSTGNHYLSHYNFILRLIRAGKLRAQNYATGMKGMAYFRVKGSEILRFNAT
jgi:hypothetical protein